MRTWQQTAFRGPWWILSWPERVPEVDEVLPPEPPAYRVLTGVVDGFGRTLAFHREAAGELAGEITRGDGRRGSPFSPALSTQAQRAEAFRKQRESSLSSPYRSPVLFPLLLQLSPTRCPPVQNTVPITVSGWRRYG